MPTRHIVVIFVAAVASLLCYQRAARNRYASTLSEAMGLIDDNYVEPIEHRELFEGAMRGMTNELDLYSGYVDEKEYAALQETIDQKFGGVGMVVDSDPDTSRPMVISVQKGAPADLAGVQPYDVLYEIDGVDTSSLEEGGAVSLIRGKPGTNVTITVRSFGDEHEKQVRIERAIIPVQTVRGYQLDEEGNWEFDFPDHPEIGYFWIESFGENTAEELLVAVESQASTVLSIVIDLRGNAGGLLDTAVEMCNMFVGSGSIVTVRGREDQVLQVFSARPNQVVEPTIPVVVLIDKYSASASEIFAACMQDHGRATVVGERSWGKGTVQHVVELEGGRSALRLTTATYWRPSGSNIHRLRKATVEDEWGVRPDEGQELALSDEQRAQIAMARRQRFRAPHPQRERPPLYVDPHLKRALELLSTGEPVPMH